MLNIVTVSVQDSVTILTGWRHYPDISIFFLIKIG